MKKNIEIVAKSWQNGVLKIPFAIFGKKTACFAIDLLVKQAKKSSGDWIRTNDLRVMSPTSCLCSTPHRHTYNTAILSFRQGHFFNI